MVHVWRIDPEMVPQADSKRSDSSPTVSKFVLEAARNPRDFVQQSAEELSARVSPDTREVMQFENVRESIIETPGAPMQVTVEGVFFPALLLCSGWWERRYGRSLADATEWKDNLQHWLFSGFERWGPSLDVNPPEGQDKRYLLGQIGRGDEADSLLMVIAPSKAGPLREQLHNGLTAFSVRATGLLCHRKHIPDAEARLQASVWGASFDYCLLVAASNVEHDVRPIKKQSEMYSGYLWQCWLPRERARTEAVSDGTTVLLPPKLTDVYFTWEHTDLASLDAIRYNEESLQQKANYISRAHGELVLVQKSSELLYGEQALSKHDFYRLMMRMPLG